MNSSSLDSKNVFQRLDQQNQPQPDSQRFYHHFHANFSAGAAALAASQPTQQQLDPWVSSFPSSLFEESQIPQDLRPHFVPWSCCAPSSTSRLDSGIVGWVSPAVCNGQDVARKDDKDFDSQAVEAEARIFISLILPKIPKFADLSSHIVELRGVTVVPPATTPPQFSMLLERADADLSRCFRDDEAFASYIYPVAPVKFCGVDVDPVKRRISIGNNFPLILDFALQIAKGLKYLHVVKKIVHHDLQESNVLVFFRHSEHRFHLKLCDFGSALRVGAKIPSPLQDPGRRNDESSPCLYEHASPTFDVYSFGVVLRHLMPSDISSQQTALERGLRDLQRKCLHHNPAERPKDGGVLVQALRRLSGDDDSDPLESCAIAYEISDEVDEVIDECNEPILPQPETVFTLLSSFRPSRCTPPEYFATLWEANREPSTFASTLDPAIASLWSKRKYAGKYRSIMLPESDENNQVNDGYSAHSASSLWSVSNSITDPQDVRFQFLVAQANSGDMENPPAQKRISIEEVKLLRSPFATRFFLGVHDHFPATPINEESRIQITGCVNTETLVAATRMQHLIDNLAVNSNPPKQDEWFGMTLHLILGWQVLTSNEVNDVLKYGPSVNFSSGNNIYNKRMDAAFFLDAQSALVHAGDRSGCLVLFLISVCKPRFHFDIDPANPDNNYEVDEIEKYDSSMNGNNEKVIFINNRLRALPVAVCQGVSMK